MKIKEFIRDIILTIIKVRLNLLTVGLLLIVLGILEDIQSIFDIIWLVVFTFGYWYFSRIDIRKAIDEVKKDE